MASGDSYEAIEVADTQIPVKEHPGVSETPLHNEDKERTGISKSGQDVSSQNVGVPPKASLATQRNKAEREKERERKIGHRRVGVGGEITYKKIQSTQIMGSIQLGKL
ncbi:hypothetical protein QE152_g15227 [Popillia japonica]|uniref:Uncharacterized protein n=1 Tax=Popillia japonica TaxID=7064 RepID=A0AAW1L913_POPJA